MIIICTEKVQIATFYISLTLSHQYKIPPKKTIFRSFAILLNKNNNKMEKCDVSKEKFNEPGKEC